LNQRQLASALFPLGDFLKRDVTSWGRETPVADLLTDESQEICFIPKGSYREFLSERADGMAGDPHGPIVDLEGRVLGRHKGIAAYTVGQRRGLGIASNAPYYVVAIDAPANTVRVGRAEDLNRSEIEVGNVNWVSIDPPPQPLHARVRVRNQHCPAPALLTPSGADRLRVRFDLPQRAVTPGQSAVFYDHDIVLGGGVIQPFF
jgi:tRNA-specific 2-thiouridylase